MVPGVFARMQLEPVELNVRGVPAALERVIRTLIPEITQTLREEGRDSMITITVSVDAYKAPRRPLDEDLQ